MRTLPVVLLLAVAAEAQVPPARQCDGPVCVGVDGQDVNLGGTVLETRGPYPDAGLAVLKPIVADATLELQGIQAVGNPGRPDVVIRSQRAHDGGTIISFRNNQTEIFAVTASGTTTTGSETMSGTLKVAILDAGVANIQGQLGVAGNVAIAGTIATAKADVLDAGLARFNGSVQIVAGLSSGNCTLGGESPSVCPAQTALAGSRCVCQPVGTSAAIAAAGCAVSLSGSTLTVTSLNGGTHVVNWHCF